MMPPDGSGAASPQSRCAGDNLTAKASDEFAAEAHAAGFDDTRAPLGARYKPRRPHSLSTHAGSSHRAMWLTCDGVTRRLSEGDTCSVARLAPHSERYWSQGVTCWAARWRGGVRGRRRLRGRARGVVAHDGKDDPAPFIRNVDTGIAKRIATLDCLDISSRIAPPLRKYRGLQSFPQCLHRRLREGWIERWRAAPHNVSR